jgi:hypothetical protein
MGGEGWPVFPAAWSVEKHRDPSERAAIRRVREFENQWNYRAVR